MNYGGLFDFEKKEMRVSELESLMSQPNFWNSDDSSKVIEELNSLKDIINKIRQIKKDILENLDVANMLKEESELDLFNMLCENNEIIKKKLDDFKLLLLLNGPYDNCDSILENTSWCRRN